MRLREREASNSSYRASNHDKFFSDNSGSNCIQTSTPSSAQKIADCQLTTEVTQDIISASKNGSFCDVLHLLENGADVNKGDKYRRTPLQGAAFNGHLDVASLLICHGANISVKNTWDGLTAIHQAASGGHEKIVSLLLEAGAKVLWGHF